MNSGANKQFEPVCRFGPGGDFISIWPEPSELQPASWKSQRAFKNIRTHEHARQLPDMFSKSYSLFVKQPMLFPDDQIGLKAAYRPRLRTRARRRTTEKRLRNAGEQNLLFATLRQAQGGEQSGERSRTADIGIAKTAWLILTFILCSTADDGQIQNPNIPFFKPVSAIVLHLLGINSGLQLLGIVRVEFTASGGQLFLLQSRVTCIYLLLYDSKARYKHSVVRFAAYCKMKFYKFGA
jgi:hypothetical protein